MAALREGTCAASRCYCADIIQQVGMGIVVFDTERRAIVLLNGAARETLERLAIGDDYESLRAALWPEDVATLADGLPLEAPPLQMKQHLVRRTLRASGPLAWALIEDVTEKARLESIAEAVEMMNNIGFVFSALRHELGNPVNSLKAALSVLHANIDRFPRATVVDYIGRMQFEVGRVETLLRSMKSFSIYERQEKRRVDIEEFLSAFDRLVREGAASCGVAVTIERPEGLCAHCDPRALQQVMLNVFANAVDAVKGRDERRVTITAGEEGGLVSIRVADTGAGVTPEQRKQLFKPFFTSKEHGTGLGLVISRKLLAGMDGTIAIESEGVGATAIITLPACPAATSPRPSAPARSGNETSG